MIFTKRLREGVRRGQITCSIRIWQRPHVTIGRRYRMEEGEIEVESILPISLADITPELARASGFKGVVDLLKVAKHGRGENVYLVGFRFVPPPTATPRRSRREPARALGSRGSGRTMTAVDRAKGNPEALLRGFIDKFDPENRALIRAVRRALRKRFSTAYELAYDNYNFFVLGYSPTERPSDAVVSMAAGANGVGLCFIRGATLPDPKRILLGSGSQTRFIRVPSLEVLARPEVKALFAAAVAQSRARFRTTGRPTLIIRSISAKQRPRRRTRGSKLRRS